MSAPLCRLDELPDGACVEGPAEGLPLEPVAVRVEAGAVYLA